MCYGCSAVFTVCVQVFMSARVVFLEFVYSSPSTRVLYARVGRLGSVCTWLNGRLDEVATSVWNQ